MQQASEYELELLKVIWNNGGTALYADIAGALSDRGMEWTKNTIITLLSRLGDKGLLKTHKIGHRNKYTAVVSLEQYQTGQTESFLDKFYEGSAKGLVLSLLRKELLSREDYEDLKKYWQDGDKTGG